MKSVVLIGDGGHSKVIKDIIITSEKYKLIAIFDDKYVTACKVEDFLYGPVVNVKYFCEKQDIYFVVAIGDNLIRKKIFSLLQIPIERYATIIHPTAIISPNVEIGQGTVIMPNVVINANVKIGKHVIVNTSAVIEHESIIHDFVHIAPNATLTGNVTVHEGTQISAAATIIPKIEIGSWCIVGAGSTVINNVSSYSTVVGSPARVIDEKENAP